MGETPYLKKGFHKKQENHAIIDNMMDELQMVESKKVSAVNNETAEFLESDYDANYLYQVENKSLDETKVKWNDVSVRLNTKIQCDWKLR